MSFINVFGGGTLQPTDVSYRAFNLSANLALVWPAFSQTGNDYVARINDVTPLAPGYTITMPPANQISTGFDILWRNLGSTSFNVLDNAGSTLLTVPAGTMQLLYLTDNTTTHGAWGTITFGAGSAALNVASVAGYGLQAVGALLQSSIATALVSATPFAINAASLAQSFVWTGGVGTYNLPTVATVGNTFWFAVRNQGTGVLTIQPQASEFIDGLSSTTLQPGDSCLILAGVSANWYSVGRGRQDAFNFTELVQTVTGGTLTLSLTQAANVVQRYTGALTANQIIVVPAVVQVYYVQNATSGGFTLTIQSPTPGTVVSVPAGQNAILFCDGTNVVNASTTVAGLSSITLNQGSAASPSFNFSGDLSTGFFQPLSHAIATTINGAEVGRWTAAGYNGVIGATTPALAYVTALNESAPISLASAGVVAIGAAASNNITITGTTTITAFDTVAAGICRKVKFTGILTLTYNATSLVLPGAASMTTQVGDEATFRSLSAGNWECISYLRADGTPVNISTMIHAASSKTTPVDADELAMLDSAASFSLAKLTWANLKATLLAYFSALTGTWAISTTGNAATSTTTTNATNIVGSGTISNTTTGGASLTPKALSNGTGSIVLDDVGYGMVFRPTVNGSSYEYAWVDAGGTVIMHADSAGKFTANSFVGNASTATSATNQAIVYTTATTPLPASSSQYVASHSLGVVPGEAWLELTCLSAEGGYSVGDVVQVSTWWNGSASVQTPLWKTSTQVGYAIGASVGVYIVDRSTYGSVSPTAAKWSYRFALRKN